MKLVMPAALALALLVGAQQAPPRTDVYLASLSSGSTPTVTGPVVNISESPGYDNQPSYLPDGTAVLFTSDRADNQTDIFQYDIASKALTRLTHDPANEYSPLVMPGGRRFSVVHGSEQSLWAYDLDGTHGQLLYQHKGKIGYHAWIDPTHLAVFMLGDNGSPNTLQIVDIKARTAKTVASSIGRSLLMRSGTDKLTFVDKSARDRWIVKELDPKTHATTTLVETPPGTEDCAWDPATGMLLMASGTRILAWSPSRKDAGWRTLGDLASAGIRNITRLAVNPVKTAAAAGRLALVAESRD
jgi:dipeptidyl aminopeptidase/acylaminoacyl peptidase